MNYQVLKLAKTEFESMSGLFDTLEEKGVIESPSSSIKLRDILRMDVAQYLMYLSAADGRIDANEVTVFQVVTGYGDSASDIVESIKNNNIYSTAFESTVPISLKIAVEAEYKLLRVTGETREVTLPELFVNMFERIGSVLIEADGGVTYNERRDLNIYLDTLRGYMHDRGF